MMEELRNDGEENTFGWADYLVFVLMLVASAAIGVYYACVGRKKTSTDEFLMAGRNMGTFPVAMSLIASFMSAITLLGTPAEIYQFGTIYWLIIFSFFFVMPAANFLYMPIFYNLQCTSAYEVSFTICFDLLKPHVNEHDFYAWAILLKNILLHNATEKFTVKLMITLHRILSVMCHDHDFRTTLHSYFLNFFTEAQI